MARSFEIRKKRNRRVRTQWATANLTSFRIRATPFGSFVTSH